MRNGKKQRTKWLEAVPGQFQKHFAFPLALRTDQPKQTLQHECQESTCPQSKDHLEKNCRSPQPVKIEY